MIEHNVTVERLQVYDPADAVGIGRLMPFLNPNFSDEPMAEDLLREIIASPHHDQLVARLEGIIVGAATLSTIMGPGVGKEGYLSDFVADPSVRRARIGDRIWNEMIRWCKEQGYSKIQGVDLAFTSHPAREAAHRFYEKHGAEIRDTTVFHVPVKGTS